MNPVTVEILQRQFGCANLLFCELVKRYQLKNFGRLAQQLGVTPPVISKMRRGHLSVGAAIIIYIHEEFDMPIAEIKALAGIPGLSRYVCADLS